jgi:hypothetical protein
VTSSLLHFFMRFCTEARLPLAPGTRDLILGFLDTWTLQAASTKREFASTLWWRCPIARSRSPFTFHSSTRVEIQKSGKQGRRDDGRDGRAVERSSGKIGSAKKEKANHVSMTGLY